ncbi:hypothetical protein ACFQ49_00165, partial [Kroppenstedtia eburnea]|uniref:hypothetical protein n=1 Tax=Kroppenstedtia eburnea TaxID=714067 RepID=UPI0036425103
STTVIPNGLGDRHFQFPRFLGHSHDNSGNDEDGEKDNEKKDNPNPILVPLQATLILFFSKAGAGWWGGSDLLQRAQRLFASPPSKPICDFPYNVR